MSDYDISPHGSSAWRLEAAEVMASLPARPATCRCHLLPRKTLPCGACITAYGGQVEVDRLFTRIVAVT